MIDLLETYQHLSVRNAVEGYHDAQQALDMALNLFSGGYLPIEQRCQAENLYFAILSKLKQWGLPIDLRVPHVRVAGGSHVSCRLDSDGAAR